MIGGGGVDGKRAESHKIYSNGGGTQKLEAVFFGKLNLFKLEQDEKKFISSKLSQLPVFENIKSQAAVMNT